MRAASATSVETELQPGIKTIFMGSVYSKSYSSLVASPGSHWRKEKKNIKAVIISLLSLKKLNAAYRV